MLSADSSSNSHIRNFPRRLAKIALLVVISMGLFWFSEDFSPATIFEPQSAGWILWISYAKDLIQPFALYFFLCLGERWLRTWRARAGLALAAPTLLEFSQVLYYRVSTDHYVGSFDPMDIIMYAIGVGLAAIVEQKIFARVLNVW